MKQISFLCLLLSLFIITCTPRMPERDRQEEAALDATLKWLVLLDTGEWDRSWIEAAQSFQDVVDRGEWTETIELIRAPLGDLLSRKILTIQYTDNLPDAQEGKYFIIQFESSFANKDNAIETLLPSLEEDKGWRISGYYIR